jgi:MFS family permease
MTNSFKQLFVQFRQGLLARRDFRLMWMASTITSFGGQISLLALPLTAVVILEATPRQMGVLAALEAVPFTLFSLPVGVFVDRMRKLPILLCCDALIGATLLTLPVMHHYGLLSMGVLYMMGFLLGSAFVVVGTAAQVYLTHIAGRKRLIEANSLFTASDSAARLTGPGLAGALIQWLSAPYAVLLDCVGFVLSVLLMAQIRFPEQAGAARERLAVFKEIGEGLQLVRRNPILRTLTWCAGLWFLFFQGFLALETLFASRELGLSAGQIGLAHMIGGAGALLSATCAARITRALGMGTPILLGMLSSGTSWILLALIPRNSASFGLMGCALFFFDFGVTLYWINFSSLRQSVTPDALLGRMTATMRFFTVALAPIGALAAGVLGDSLGLRATLTATGSAVILLAVAAFFGSRLRHVPDLSRNRTVQERIDLALPQPS